MAAAGCPDAPSALEEGCSARASKDISDTTMASNNSKCDVKKPPLRRLRPRCWVRALSMLYSSRLTQQRSWLDPGPLSFRARRALTVRSREPDRETLDHRRRHTANR